MQYYHTEMHFLGNTDLSMIVTGRPINSDIVLRSSCLNKHQSPFVHCDLVDNMLDIVGG